jgi:hypothetical protein
MSEEEKMSRALRELPVQYLPDEQGNVQNVLVPIDLWTKLVALYEASSPPADAKQTDTAATPPLTMFGAFPELAEIEFGEQFGAVKQLGRENIEKQFESIQGNR